MFDDQDGDHNHLVGVLKSKTVPATEAIDPVGINLSETGVKLKEGESSDIQKVDKEIERQGKCTKKKEINLSETGVKLKGGVTRDTKKMKRKEEVCACV